MRANAAARHREGDHQIIEAPVRQHAERAHQFGGRFVPVVHRLRQQRPVLLPQMVKILKRAVARLPLAVNVAHQTAVNFHLHRQTGQFVRRNRVDKIRERVFQDHRLFLPVFLQKLRPVKVELISHVFYTISRGVGSIIRRAARRPLCDESIADAH